MKHDELKSIWKDAGERISEGKNWNIDLNRKKRPIGSARP